MFPSSCQQVIVVRPMAPLKVVCLISGGKDSFYSILHCLQNGHEIVALANLHPQLAHDEGAPEDVDSYMYQTIGHSIIPLYEKALGLPLYRQAIEGSAVNQSKCYGPSPRSEVEQDETEALVPLLQKVMADHPNVNAVSTGAILSDYQRTRVESVAVRLGLVPLSYLWQWSNISPHTQATLLEDMQVAGQDSRIIKVASGGLDDSFLWLNVADPRTVARIDRAVKRFGSADDGAVLGEGGEYETLAIAGPAPLWKGRLEVEASNITVASGEAGSASVRIARALVVPIASPSEPLQIRTPPLLEPTFDKLYQEATYTKANDSLKLSYAAERDVSNAALGSGHMLIPNLTAPGASAADQMASVMTLLSQRLHEAKLSLVDVAYVSIILRDMADFAAINPVYSSCFTFPNPPARVTVAEPAVLPPNRAVMVSASCIKCSPETRNGLHVQSRSYWAPANIGPYSQAISVPGSDQLSGRERHTIYIAGQIPLVPASTELVAFHGSSPNLADFAMQAVLAAQHFIRIGRAMHVEQWSAGIAFVTAGPEQDAHEKACIVRNVWDNMHQSTLAPEEDLDGSEADDFDVWDTKLGAQQHFSLRQSSGPSTAVSGQADHDILPPLHVVEVAALPRGASVEWVTYGHNSSGLLPSIPHREHLLSLFANQLLR